MFMNDIKIAMKREGLTPLQVADKLRVHPVTVERWMEGINLEHFHRFIVLCKLLKITNINDIKL